MEIRMRAICRLVLGFAILVSPTQVWAQRSTIPLEQDWWFARGDIAQAETPGFDDARWTKVDVPHDWSIAGPFDQHARATGSGGWLPTSVACYRKRFTLPSGAGARRVFVEFDGVMERLGVWINGDHVGHCPNGYYSFRYELTPHLRRGAGATNVLAVRADTAAQPASRWYAGGGTYRKVRLIMTGDVHVDTNGSFVSTPRIAADSASVRIGNRIVNQSGADAQARVDVRILDARGREVARETGASATLPVTRPANLAATIELANPRRWDVADPAMYAAVIRVVGADGAVLDEDRVSFGMREARFDPATGFWLNGRNIKLKGVAIHADGGAFGMAAPLAFYERRLRGLKALGVNAIRTAHHPFSPDFLDLCDRLGLVVMNEAFDMWTVAKNPHDYHLFFTDWSSIDALDFVRRDHNHPSVVLWSVGNEIHDTPYPIVAKSIIARLKAIFQAEDPSRPVTMALFRPNTTGDYTNGLADMLDVVGQNYRENELIAAHKAKPGRMIVGTENSKNRGSWLAVRDYAPYAGMFLWTGADYLGNADRAGWPFTGNPSGLVDRTDVVKPIGWERASWWSEAPVVKIARRVTEAIDTSELPTMVGVAMPQLKGPGALMDWTPADLSTHPETVEVYSNAPEVELFLNNRSLGRKPRNADDGARQWKTNFAPGTVRAVAWDGERRLGEDVLSTAGAPAAIRLVAEDRAIGGGFDEVGFVRVEVVDAKGVLVPSAANEVAIAVSGGALAAYDNGTISDHTMFNEPRSKVNGGRALAMVRAGSGNGPMRISATGPGPARRDRNDPSGEVR